jgi:hypothetical protein
MPAALALVDSFFFILRNFVSHRNKPKDSFTMSLLFLPIALAMASSSAAMFSGKLTDKTVLMLLTS